MKSTFTKGVASKASRALALVAIAGVTAMPASADIVGGSQGYGLHVDVGLVAGVLGIDVGPLPNAAGVAPSAYNDSNSLLSVSASALGVATLSTGLLTANASSDLVAGSTSGMTHADALVNDLLLRIVPGALFIPDLVRLEADTIGSFASVTYDGANLSTSGGFTIEDAMLSVSGIGLISINASAAPNTVLLDALGIRIVLNEQIVTNDGTTATIEVNAIRVTIDSPLQVVAADVVIGHSVATMTIPAPASLGLLAGMGLVAARRRRT